MRSLPRRRTTAVAHADAAAFARSAQRHSLARWGVLLALVGAITIGVDTARSLDTRQSAYTPPARSTVIVLDLSKSVEGTGYARVGRILAALAKDDDGLGLIIFSDAAYELLPPGTATVALRPLLRLFAPGRPGARTAQVANPWSATFSAGTRLSTAVALAGRVLRRDEVANGAVVLVSDLETSGADLWGLRIAARRLRHDGVLFRAVPLRPGTTSTRDFAAFLGDDALATPTKANAATAAAAPFVAPSSRTLVLVGLFVIALLAVNERWCARLAFPFSTGARQ